MAKESNNIFLYVLLFLSILQLVMLYYIFKHLTAKTCTSCEDTSETGKITLKNLPDSIGTLEETTEEETPEETQERPLAIIDEND